MYNDKSRKNLKPFSSKNQPKKNGRPKGSLSIMNEIKKVLEGIDEKSKKPILELFAKAVTKQAMDGNAAYFKEIIERLDGKIPEKIEQTGKGSGPVTMRIIHDTPKKENDYGLH
jgi:hypothetical protein